MKDKNDSKNVSVFSDDIYTVCLRQSIIQLPTLDSGEFIPPDASKSDYEFLNLLYGIAFQRLDANMFHLCFSFRLMFSRPSFVK